MVFLSFLLLPKFSMLNDCNVKCCLFISIFYVTMTVVTSHLIALVKAFSLLSTMLSLHDVCVRQVVR